MDDFKKTGREVVGGTYSFRCPCCNLYIRIKDGKRKLRRTTRRNLRRNDKKEQRYN